MYRRILVLLDGSARAERILPHAEATARMSDATVMLLQVVTPYVPIMDPHAILHQFSNEELRQITAEVKAYLEKKRMDLVAKNIQADIRVEQGPVVETILSCAQQEKADLIAMASHGRSGLSRVFYGSIAAGVLQRIDRPLLLIRSREAENTAV